MMDANAPTDPAWDQAAGWFTRLRDERAGPRQRAQFLRWLAEDPSHGVAYAQVAEAFAAAQKGREAGALPRLGLTSGAANHNDRRGRRAGLALAASLLVAAIIGGWVVYDPLADRYETASGETRVVALADGSTVTLAGRTRLRVRMRDDERALRLDEGEALFQVEKDPARPFRVRAAGHVVEAVGTAFDVDRRGDAVEVAVSEGTVAIADRRVTQGQALSIAAGGGMGEVRKVATDQVGAWRNGMLIYQNQPFAAVVAGLNRAFAGTMQVDDPQLAQRRVTVSIALKDRKATLETLQLVLPVRAVAGGGDRILFVPRTP